MKTRYLLTVFLSATGAGLAVGGCSTDGSNARSQRRSAPAQRPPRRLHRRADQGLPGGRGHPVPERAGAGDRLLVRLLRALHLPAALQLGAAEIVSDDAGAGLSGGNQALDRHRGRGLLSRLPLRAGRDDLRSHAARHGRLHAGVAVLRAERGAGRRRRRPPTAARSTSVRVRVVTDPPAATRRRRRDQPALRLHDAQLPGG